MQALTDSIESTFGIQAKAMKHKDTLIMREGKFQQKRNITVPKSSVNW